VDPPVPPKGEGIDLTVLVLDAATGEGIPDVLIELEHPANLIADRRTWSYKSQTDASGKSLIANIAAERYNTKVTQQGRMLVAGSTQSISFAASTKPNPLVFRMWKSASIQGVVEDLDHRLVAGATVELLEEQWKAGQRTLARIATSKPTDTEGKYAFPSVLPGSYYLRARPDQTVIRNQLRESDALPEAGQRHVAYVNTLYPAAQFLETASPLQVYSGVDQQGIRIEVQKSKYYAVRGHVDNLSPTVASPGLIFIRTVTFDSRFPFIADEPYNEVIGTNIKPDGSFAYEAGIPPGQYWAGYTPGGEGGRFGGMDFRVNDRDVELRTELWSGFPLNGKIVYEDGTPAAGVHATVRTFWSQRSIRVDDLFTDRDGTFDRPLYSDGIFRIEFDNGLAVRKIEKDAHIYPGPEFEVTRDGGPAVITLTRKGASLEGSVALHKSTEAYPRGMVTLSLEPLSPLDNVKRKRLDGINTFKFEHLETGRYRLCAWVEEGTEINRVLNNPTYDGRLSILCQSVEVKGDETKAVNLKQISALDIR